MALESLSYTHIRKSLTLHNKINKMKIKFNNPKLLGFLLIMGFGFFFSSCRKELKENSIPSNGINGIPAYPFAWETADYMPTPAGTTILVPWANGSIKGFPSDIWYDIKQSDGWELVYNVFNTSSLPANPWFVLYNKYRGLLRIYIYITSNGLTPSTYLTSGLNLAPNAVSTSMLNYIGQDLVDPSAANKTVISQMEPTQLATNTWYASQYEIAYDPQIASATYQQLGLNWTLKWTNVTANSLGGTQQGTLNGTITTPASSFNLANTIQNGVLSVTGAAIFANNQGPAADYSQNTLGLPGFIFSAFKDGLTSGLGGVIKNIYAGIFGGSSASTQEVYLKMNTNISLTGSSISSGAFIPDPGLGIGIPGISNSQSASGYIPAYNNTMGVFNITNRPTIKLTSTRQTNVPAAFIADHTPTTPYYYNQYDLINNSYSVQFNPVIQPYATISNVEVMLPSGSFFSGDSYYSFTPIIEQIGNNTTYNLGNNHNIIDGLLEYPTNGLGVVRITVKITPPNSTTPPITIVKAFVANIVN